MTVLSPGMLVLCINDEFSDRERFWTPNLPTVGRVYTIRDIGEYFRGVGVTLAEIVNKPIPVINRATSHRYFMEPVFLAERFRPIDRSKLDVFRQQMNSVLEDA